MMASVEHIATDNFETLYIQLRKKEKRFYTDEEVKELPDIAVTHPHYKEWQLRKQSMQSLREYLKKKSRPLEILEIGCGNGWLSRRLAAIEGANVTGSDINLAEIQQASKVFENISNLNFIYSDPESNLKEKKFDCIIFAASIQYFESFETTIQKTLMLLKSDGEIHILDSPFYSMSALGAAIERSKLYFEEAGFPGMSQHYFHHTLDSVANFNYRCLYNPNSLFNRFLKNKNPFYWIQIQA